MNELTSHIAAREEIINEYTELSKAILKARHLSGGISKLIQRHYQNKIDYLTAEIDKERSLENG